MERLEWRMDKCRKMKKVTIEELQEGDEIIISSGSNLKYLKLLKNPTLSSKKGWQRCTDGQGYFYWGREATIYKSLLCSTTVKEIEYKHKGWRAGEPDRIIKKKEYIFETDCTKHNIRISANLNNKDILLIKRKER